MDLGFIISCEPFCLAVKETLFGRSLDKHTRKLPVSVFPCAALAPRRACRAGVSRQEGQEAPGRGGLPGLTVWNCLAFLCADLPVE